MSEKKRSIASTRKVISYPPPLYNRLVVAHAEGEDMSISQVVTMCLKKYYDGLTSDERQAILNKAKNKF